MERETCRLPQRTPSRCSSSGAAEDLDGDPVYLARSEFYLGYTRERAPGVVFTDVKDVKASK